MFENGERSIHKDLIPTKDRIGYYKKKSFGSLYQKYEERPVSGVASSQGLGDLAT